jgi:5'-methylthioadenosine phosphorylase
MTGDPPSANGAPLPHGGTDHGGSGVAEIGVFGGSGFYALLEDVEEIEVQTPYGRPSAAIAVGETAGKRIAFLPRHGRRHELPPHAIPYRANVWAMRELGVRRILAPCASGALSPDLELGAFVICDQYVDWTTRRESTFFDGPETTHVSAADPYCPDLRRLLVQTARELGIPTHDGGTVVVVEGPRFSTRAESLWYRAAGWQLINMTACPEAHLARELGMCYASIAMVTDHDVGAADERPVSAEMVKDVFARNNTRLRELLLAVMPRIGHQPDDICATALVGARIS